MGLPTETHSNMKTKDGSGYIKIRKWEKYQHYKDGSRQPPWIKLHQEILSSRMWVSCSPTDRMLAVAIMLLASRHNNKIPLDLAYIRRVAYLEKIPCLQNLQDCDFIEIINVTLADDSTKVVANATASPSLSLSSNKVSISKSSKKRAKQLDVETLPADWREYCCQRRPDLNPENTFENFSDYYIGKGQPMVDWKRTWQRWVRNEKHSTSSRRPDKTPADRNREATERYLRECSGRVVGATD